MPNEILEILKGGNLISDGRADEAANMVLHDPEKFSALLKGLSAPEDFIRGQTAHALEKVARIHPDWFVPHLKRIMLQTLDDPLPMVRWHLVMLLTSLAEGKNQERIIDLLLACLQDGSAFVVSWAISGLCILGRRHPQRAVEIIHSLLPLRTKSSAAIRGRAAKAVERLENPMLPIPKGWIKRYR